MSLQLKNVVLAEKIVVLAEKCHSDQKMSFQLKKVVRRKNVVLAEKGRVGRKMLFWPKNVVSSKTSTAGVQSMRSLPGLFRT